MMEKNLTKEIVLEMLEYIPSTGMLLQKKARPKVKVGSVAGVVTPKGYRYIQLQGTKYAAHRIVWMLEYGAFPSLFIDHIDGNKLNNQISNLREVTNKQNCENRGAQKNNKTGIKGVSYNKKLKKFVAQIQHCGVNHYLGLHNTPQKAQDAYNNAASKLFTHHGKQYL